MIPNLKTNRQKSGNDRYMEIITGSRNVFNRRIEQRLPQRSGKEFI